MRKIIVLKSDNRRSQLPLIINGLSDQINFQVYSSDKIFLDQLTIDKKKKKKIKTQEEPKSFGDWLFYSIFAPLLGPFVALRLAKLRTKKYSAIILTSLQDFLLVTPWARLLGLKVYWFHNTYLDFALTANIYSLLLRWFSHFVRPISTSQAIADHLISDFGFRKESLVVINRGIDLEHLKIQADIYEDMVSKEYQIQNKALFVIGFIGDLKIENGLEYLIKAVEHFKELIPDFQMIIVGDGEHKKSLIWLTKLAGLSNHVRYVGKQDMVQRWYKYFDILVFPRITKTNFANVVAEAMANGIPVVTTDVEGVKEIVNNQGGLVVPPKDAHALAEAMYQLYNDKALRAQFGKQAQARIQKEYSMEVMLKKFENILN